MANFTPLSAAIGGALIGLAALLLMLLAGRVAGICGISAGILGVGAIDRGWRLAFIAGLILAPVAAMLAGYAVPVPHDAGKLVRRHHRRLPGRLRRAARRRLHLRPWRLRHRAALQALDRRHHGLHGRGGDRRRADAPCDWRLIMLDPRLSRLRLHLRPRAADLRHDAAGEGARLPRHPRHSTGAWDPSLAVVMAAALAVAGRRLLILAQQRPQPVLAPKFDIPAKTAIDTPLVAGSALFGIGWGSAGSARDRRWKISRRCRRR